MSRFLLVFAFLMTALPAFAASKVYAPPLEGEMTRLTVYNPPVKIPDVLLSADGKGLTNISEFKTKLVVVNLWATWCPPCVEELPSLNALQLAMKDDSFEVVTISIDTLKPSAVKKYMDDNNLKALTPYMDINQGAQRWEVLKGVAGVPVTLILDPQSRVLARFEANTDWNGPEARKVLEYYKKNVSFSLFD